MEWRLINKLVFKRSLLKYSLKRFYRNFREEMEFILLKYLLLVINGKLKISNII